MVDRSGRVRVQGSNVPMNLPQDTPQPPPTNPYYPYPGEDPYNPSPQASSWDSVRQWLTESEPFSFFRNAQENLNNLPVVGEFFENASLAGPPGARERFNEGVSEFGDLLKASPIVAGIGGLVGGMFDDGSSQLPPPPTLFTESDAATGMQQGPEAPPYEEIVAQYQFDGTPYDQAADYMQKRRAAQMRAVQDMYNQYAAETQANVDRIGDIYGGAEAGIGETYGGATGAIEDAYGSAQQQAADQLARLGIEEAAPAVIDPMALSQAETLSNLETNRAGSLGATQQFGATAGGFATDMATVAQQQALENQRSATDQLADQLFELEMQRAQAQQAYNPHLKALQELEGRQAYENLMNPSVDTSEMYDRLRDQQQDFMDRNEFYLQQMPNDSEEAMRRTVEDAMRGIFGEEMRNRILNDPNYAPYIPQELLG
jgi:hypothetical protein